MTIIDDIARRFGYTRARSDVDYARAVVGPYQSGMQATDPDKSIYAAQAETMRRLSWINSAVGRVSEMFATLAEFQVMKLEGEDTTPQVNHGFEQLLRSPNPFQSEYEFKRDLAGFLKINGNCYIWLNAVSPDLPPAEMFLLRPDRVTIVPDANLYIGAYVYTVDERSIVFDPAEIVHLKTQHPLNDWYGLSAIESLALAAESDWDQSKWNRNFFGKNNAKPQGILAFADDFSDPSWEKKKDDVRREHGGTERRMMMLRGAGKGGVEYTTTAFTQKEMEFLAGRQFNKEEIYQILAPGLLQIVDKNVTEANSSAGERVFREQCLWVMMVQAAQKLTQRVMPRYGDDLIVECEDIRWRDKAQELAEQEAYAGSHTIDEIRAKYYGDDPIGDERGDLMVAEIGRGMTGTSQSPISPLGQPEAGQQPGGANDPNAQNADQTALAADTEGKALEREQYRRFVKRHAGKPERIAAFEFKQLNTVEQAQLIAEVHGQTLDAADLQAKFSRVLDGIEAAVRGNGNG